MASIDRRAAAADGGVAPRPLQPRAGGVAVENGAAGAARSESLRQALEREHRDIDQVIKACADVPVASPAARTALKQAVAELRRHIYVEEELLFPRLRAAGMTGPVLVMLREHAQMWPMLDTLEDALGDGSDQAALRTACGELFVLLQHHNPKEEQILYPQVDHVVDDVESHGVLELLNTGQMPPGWICHLLRRWRADG